MNNILARLLENTGTIGLICATIIVSGTVLLTFKETLKAFFSAVIERRKRACAEIAITTLTRSVDKLSDMLNTKIASDSKMCEGFSIDLKEIRNEIEDMTKQVSNLIEKNRNRETSYVLLDDHVDKILEKLDKFNDTLVAISTKIEYMSKSRVGF